MLMLSLLLAETEIQSADADYLAPIALAYGIACAIWVLVKTLAGERWPDESVAVTDKRWIDLISVLLVAIGVFAIGGLLLFQLLRGEIAATGQVLQKSISLHALSHFPAVFLEAVAVAFVLVRLKWVVGTLWAIAIPSLLFALAHVPSGIENDRSVAELVTFFVFNSCIAAAIFGVVAKSRDVIWIAIPHYILDVASGLFG